MSRLAKKPIMLPEKVDASYTGGVLTVKGPLGSLSRTIRPYVTVSVDAAARTVSLAPVDGSIAARAMVGTYVAHLKNMIAGVQAPYEKKLVIEGIGYKADVKGADLVLAVGFSHPVSLPIPAGLTVKVDKTTVSVSGIDREKVGQFAADVRATKKPEPYLGKGIHYSDEVVRRKQGKKAA